MLIIIVESRRRSQHGVYALVVDVNLSRVKAVRYLSMFQMVGCTDLTSSLSNGLDNASFC
jgi:hypothetical protein